MQALNVAEHQNDYFFNQINNQRDNIWQQQFFMELLYGDQYANEAVVFRTVDKMNDVPARPSKPEELYTDDMQHDIQIALNTFKERGMRCNQDCYCITATCIDIDKHDNNQLKVRQAVINTETKLNAACNRGDLLAPSFVVRTGRGLQCYWVLEHSINADKKQIVALYKAIVAALQKKISSFLDKTCCQVDRSVGLAESQLVRLPGTVNQANGEKVYISAISHEKYNLDAFKALLPAPCANPNKKVVRIDHDANAAMYMLQNRIDFCRRVQAEHAYNGRNELLFVFTASLLPLETDKDAAWKMVQAFNQGFKQPLPEREVKETFNSCCRHSYKLTTERIASHLGMDEHTLKEYGLCASKRALNKAQNASNKQERDERILDMAKKKENGKYIYTYQEIAKELGVGERTVRNILSCSGFTRNDVKLKSKYKPKYKDNKTAKKCTIQCTAPFGASDTSLPLPDAILLLPDYLPGTTHARCCYNAFLLDVYKITKRDVLLSVASALDVAILSHADLLATMSTLCHWLKATHAIRTNCFDDFKGRSFPTDAELSALLEKRKHRKDALSTTKALNALFDSVKAHYPVRDDIVDTVRKWFMMYRRWHKTPVLTILGEEYPIAIIQERLQMVNEAILFDICFSAQRMSDTDFITKPFTAYLELIWECIECYDEMSVVPAPVVSDSNVSGELVVPEFTEQSFFEVPETLLSVGKDTISTFKWSDDAMLLYGLDD